MVGRIVALLKARFGSENQAQRFRAELKSRKQPKGESLQKLYQDVSCLMSLAYPGESSALSDIVGCDAFLEALDDQALRVRILEKEPKNLDDALNMASRLEAFDIMDSTGQEAEKSKSRFARAAAGGKESTSSEATKVSEDILKQLADLKTGISRLTHVRPEQRGQERAVLSHSPPRISANQSDWAVVTFGMKENTECAADLDLVILPETVERGATVNAEPPRDSEVHWRRLKPREGRSTSSPMDGTKWTCTWPSD